MKWLLKYTIGKDSIKNLRKIQGERNKSESYLKFFKPRQDLISTTCFFLIFLQLIQVGLNYETIRKEITKFHLESHSNEITIKIFGVGDQYVVSEVFSTAPDSIYLNNNLVTPYATNSKSINIPVGSGNSTVKLVWNSQLNNLYKLFAELDNLLEVDLSYFDSSLVFQMTYMFCNCTSLEKINFNNFNTHLVEHMDLIFLNCSNLTSLDLSNFDTSNAKTMNQMFSGCILLKSLDLTRFDTSQVTDMENMFNSCESLESLNLSNFNTVNVIKMSQMFRECNSLSFLDVSNFNTLKVTEMSFMFFKCLNLTSLDLSSFNTQNVEDMMEIFWECRSLVSLDISNFDTSKVKRFYAFFAYCESLVSLDLSHFNTASSTDMEYMFYDCSSLISLDISNFDVSNSESITGMFYDCFSLSSLKMTNINTNNVKYMDSLFWRCNSLTTVDLSKFNTNSVESLDNMFYHCESLLSLDLSNFNTPNLESMYKMFDSCYELTSLDISHLKTEKVTNMEGLFYECKKLSSLDLRNFNTAEVNNTSQMFYNCKSMNPLDISTFNTQKVENMKQMFSGCESLVSLDLSNFDTSQVTTMEEMFNECKLINYLDITSFNTSKVENMYKMFFNCVSLNSLDLSNFDTSMVTNMNRMFESCQNLVTLDLSSFRTSNVQDMDSMFHHCKRLADLDITNFRTDSLIGAGFMFGDCQSLTSLDLSKFETSKLIRMYGMFYNMVRLTELNLANFDTTSLDNIEFLVYGCTSLRYINFQQYNENIMVLAGGALDNNVDDYIVICIDETKTITKFWKEIEKKNCYTIYCGDDWRNHIKKKVHGTDNCVEDCSSYVYESNNECYSVCPEGKEDECRFPSQSISTTNIASTMVIEQNNPIVTTNIASTNFEEVNNPIESTNIIPTSHIEERNNIATTNIESTNIISTSHIDERNNIITTNIESTGNDIILFSQISSNEESINRQTNSEINFIISSSLLIKETTEKIKNENPYNITGENNEEIYEEIKDIIDDYDPSDGGEVLIEGKDNFLYQITTTDNEKDALDGKNNSKNLVSKIDLGECENILKDFYHINRSVSLIIVKFEKISNVSIERTLQYEIYEPFNKTKLNLSLCDKTPITVYTPVVLSDDLLNLYNEIKDSGYDLFNINSSFYNDICTPFKSPNGTDVSLSDRKNYYFNNDETLCQPNCQFSDYSVETKLLKCECDVSNAEINTKVIKKFDKKDIYQSFFDTLKFSNYKVLKCYKLAFHINSITVNKGSILAIIYFCIYFAFLIIYIIKGIRQLKVHFAKGIFKFNRKLSDEVSSKESNKNIGMKINKNIYFQNKNKNKSHKSTFNSSSKELKKSKKKRIKNKNIKNLPPKKKSSLKNTLATDKTRASKQMPRNVDIYSKKYSDRNILSENKLIYFNNYSSVKFQNKGKVDNKNNPQIKEAIPEEKLDNFELNNLDYDLAMKLDKRSFINIYWSILRREHLILFTFFVRNDYNLVYVKFSRFIFLVCTDMALNVFFFADETMHKMFLDYGKYNFMQQIPQIAYSTLVTQLIEVFLCFLSMTDKYFYEIKNLESDSRYEVFKIIKCVKIKITFYFIFTCIMFAFYWYAIACFCAVYVNTQNAFIKDSLSSFALGLLYPFILYLIPAVLRLIALRATNSRLSFIYTLSDIIPFF